MGVGMPAGLKLQDFGSVLWGVFGGPAYHVGSSVTEKLWRDVDVRVILSDEDYASMGFGDPKHAHLSEKWIGYCLAFSALGKEMTGLPIDFQIQQQTQANTEFEAGVRSAIGVVPLRRTP